MKGVTADRHYGSNIGMDEGNSISRTARLRLPALPPRCAAAAAARCCARLLRACTILRHCASTTPLRNACCAFRVCTASFYRAVNAGAAPQRASWR